MVDLQTVCCMCGDVGFPDKLFRCTKCRGRFQHTYCSSYYSKYAEPTAVCDWCQCEERNTPSPRQGNSSRKSSQVNINTRSTYSGDKIKHDRVESSSEKSGRNSSGTPSPRPAARRYKLLKDVMC